MSFSLLRLPAVVLLIAGASGIVSAAEPAILVKARAYLGTDEALDALRTVHFKGRVIGANAAEPGKDTNSTIEIIAQKPDQQRVVAQSATMIETTVVSGYEGWQRTVEIANPMNRRLVVFKPDAVKRLRAQAWENLSFFRGIERQGGRVEEMGTKTIDGIECVKVAFIHAPNVIFYRYFDPATGRLVQTETEDGGTTREEGENVVNGIRFPQRMQMTMRGPGGQSQSVVVHLDSITVNSPVSPDLFQMPSPGSQ